MKEDKEKIITPARRRLVCSSYSQHQSHLQHYVCFFGFFLRVKNTSLFCLTLSAFHLCWWLQTANAYGTVHLENGVKCNFYVTYCWILFSHSLFLCTLLLFSFVVFFSSDLWWNILLQRIYYPSFLMKMWKKNSKKSLQIRNINNTSTEEKTNKQTTPTQCA